MVFRLYFTHHSLSGGTQTIPLFLTVCLVEHRLSLYSSQSPWWYSHYPYTHHSLPGGLRVSIYSSQSPWWNSDYPYIHHRLPPGTQTIPVLIRVSLVVLRLILNSSQSPWCYSDYPYTHHCFPDGFNYPYAKHSLPCGTHPMPIHITVSLVVFRLSL